MTGESHWRQQAAPLIREVIAQMPGADESRIKLALHAAFPWRGFGQQARKAWLAEIDAQMGKRQVKAKAVETGRLW